MAIFLKKIHFFLKKIKTGKLDSTIIYYYKTTMSIDVNKKINRENAYTIVNKGVLKYTFKIKGFLSKIK